jgi:hypothetical protein
MFWKDFGYGYFNTENKIDIKNRGYVYNRIESKQ